MNAIVIVVLLFIMLISGVIYEGDIFISDFCKTKRNILKSKVVKTIFYGSIALIIIFFINCRTTEQTQPLDYYNGYIYAVQVATDKDINVISTKKEDITFSITTTTSTNDRFLNLGAKSWNKWTKKILNVYLYDRLIMTYEISSCR